MKRNLPFSRLLCVCALALTVACAGETQPHKSSSTDAPNIGAENPPSKNLAQLVPYGREPWPGVITAGQPSKEDFEALKEAGVRTVINLRVPSERGTRDEPAWMEELGFAYVSIPVQGAAGLGEELARELDRVLETAERPVLVHCGSSNRVGAAFALRAFYVEGYDPAEALGVGTSAGVTKLEGRVRELLSEASGQNG